MRRIGGPGSAPLVVLLVAACRSTTASKSPGSEAALARIKSAVRLTEDAGTAHLAIDSDGQATFGRPSAAKKQADHLTVVGDIRFAGPDLSLTNKAQTGNVPAPTRSMSIYIGKDLYLSASLSPSRWVRGTNRQPYAYLGAVTTKALTTTKGPVTVVGVRSVDGQPATEYLVPIPGAVQTLALTNSNNQPYNEQITMAPFIASVWLDGLVALSAPRRLWSPPLRGWPGPSLRRPPRRSPTSGRSFKSWPPCDLFWVADPRSRRQETPGLGLPEPKWHRCDCHGPL